MNSLPILYHDKHLVAVNKPSGLLVHRSDVDRHETRNAMKSVRDQLGQWVYPVHRLDKATSGALLFALDKETARQLAELFSGGRVCKSYLAVVRGFTREEEQIDHPLKEKVDKMTDQKADKDKPGKQAITGYRRLATIEIPRPVGRYSTARYSLVKAAPLTGRTHQIRRHMKHIFHPVVGDTTYGDGRQNDFFRQNFNCCRLLLHAHSIAFVHPYTGAQLYIQAPLDTVFCDLFQTLHWDNIVPRLSAS
jgi:tRNA pseudouridine65 synthase